MRASEFAELRAFAEVARRGSFARAAAHLRIAPSTLSQTVRTLEERLGVTLLHRTTRQVATTSAGARLLERLAPTLDELEAAVGEAREGRTRPSGVVRLHAPRPAFASHVKPMLGRIATDLPDVTLDLTLDEAPVEVAVSGYDLIIARSEFVDSVMLARDLPGDLRHAVVASPDYLAEHGIPTSPAMLSEHRCILWRPPGGDVQRWCFEEHGEPLTLAVHGSLIVSHCDVAVAAARQGAGVACVLETYSAPFVADRTLSPLLIDFQPSLGSWKLCHPKQVRQTAAVQAIAELLIFGSTQEAITIRG